MWSSFGNSRVIVSIPFFGILVIPVNFISTISTTIWAYSQKSHWLKKRRVDSSPKNLSDFLKTNFFSKFVLKETFQTACLGTVTIRTPKVSLDNQIIPPLAADFLGVSLSSWFWHQGSQCSNVVLSLKLNLANNQNSNSEGLPGHSNKSTTSGGLFGGNLTFMDLSA